MNGKKLRKRTLNVVLMELVFLLTLLTGLFPYTASSETGEEPSKGNSNRIVITAEDIRRMNVRSIVDLLNHIPGVSAGESVVRIRGSSMVKVLLDGRPINDPLSGHRGIKWNLVPFNAVKEVVVYKGEGSVVFGENTTGGVISITTEKTGDSRGNIEISAGNPDTSRFNLDYYRNISLFGAGISLGREKTGGYRVNGDKDKKKMGLKFDYKGEDYKFDLFLDYGREERGIPGQPAFPTPEARSENKTFGVALNGEIGQLRSRSYFNRFDKEHANPEIDLETGLSSWTVGESLDYAISTKRWGLFNVGAMAEVAMVRGNKVKSRQEEKYGLYITKSLHLQSIPLTLSLGLRGNFYSEFPIAVNPEIKATFNKKDFSISASLSKTNNTPTFIQRYYETSTTRINPGLGMEKSTNYTLSFFYRPQKSMEGSLSLFFSKIHDRITYDRQDDGTGSYENLGEVTRRGADVSFKWRPVESLTVKSSYTYLIARDETTGNWLPYSPRHKIKLDIKFRPVQALTLSLDTKYASRQFSRSDNSESVPGYLVTGLRAKYHLKKLQLFADIANLFNNNYLYGDGFPAPPRTWLLGAGYEF